ncbi:hypothetical protein Tco_0950725 [Tanacetum coccineum]
MPATPSPRSEIIFLHGFGVGGGGMEEGLGGSELLKMLTRYSSVAATIEVVVSPSALVGRHEREVIEGTLLEL